MSTLSTSKIIPKILLYVNVFSTNVFYALLKNFRFVTYTDPPLEKVFNCYYYFTLYTFIVEDKEWQTIMNKKKNSEKIDKVVGDL